MSKKRLTEMKTKELDEATSEFDQEFAADTFGNPDESARDKLDRAERKPGRPAGGAGAKPNSVKVEKPILARTLPPKDASANLRKEEPTPKARKKKAVHRQQLFEQYAENLHIYFPQAAGVFVCPICTETYNRDQVEEHLSLAHILTEKLGGRKLTLLCRTCNNRFGAEYESHAVREKRLRESFQGGQPVEWKVENYEGQVSLAMAKDISGFKLDVVSAQSNPIKVEELSSAFRGNTVGELKLQTRGFDKRKRTVSLIASAWLAMFKHFGYEYVCSENVTHLRAYLVKPDLQYSLNKLGFWVRDEAPASPQPEYRISILHDPSDFVGFVVDFPILAVDGKWPGVFLPGFGDDGQRAYERWLSIDSSDEITNFSCKFLKQFSELTNQSYKHFCRWIWNNLALDH